MHAKNELLSYIVRYDHGFAPNPFGGVCTLACCKPVIRQNANIGDWVMGTTPAPDAGKLVYAMEVNKTLLFGQYFNAPEFQHKKPSAENPYGDNIHKEITPGEYGSIENYFHDTSDCEKDHNSSRVLISYNFYYFGKRAVPIPKEYASLVYTTQGHLKKDGNSKVVGDFLEWLKQFPTGVYGMPRDALKPIKNTLVA
ncbi:MAG: hypothetical protein J0L77_06400 [Alphaproteobacteria bacterium]|nr:hypothetical protein [Alphaproteobacteria bacterium]